MSHHEPKVWPHNPLLLLLHPHCLRNGKTYDLRLVPNIQLAIKPTCLQEFSTSPTSHSTQVSLLSSVISWSSLSLGGSLYSNLSTTASTVYYTPLTSPVFSKNHTVLTDVIEQSIDATSAAAPTKDIVQPLTIPAVDSEHAFLDSFNFSEMRCLRNNVCYDACAFYLF